MIKVNKALFDQPADEQLKIIDGLMTGIFSINSHVSSRDLTPVPLLGVPGWWTGNEDMTFYGNTEYFRAAKNDENRENSK